MTLVVGPSRINEIPLKTMSAEQNATFDRAPFPAGSAP